MDELDELDEFIDGIDIDIESLARQTVLDLDGRSVESLEKEVIETFNIVSEEEEAINDPEAVTFSRIAQAFPHLVAVVVPLMDFEDVVTSAPKGFPKVMMTNAFPGLIPRAPIGPFTAPKLEILKVAFIIHESYRIRAVSGDPTEPTREDISRTIRMMKPVMDPGVLKDSKRCSILERSELCIVSESGELNEAIVVMASEIGKYL